MVLLGVIESNRSFPMDAGRSQFTHDEQNVYEETVGLQQESRVVLSLSEVEEVLR